jgi:hypothetical protein
VNLADGQPAYPYEIVREVADRVVIEHRFRGPSDSGNGGYVCGALARFAAPRSAEVTLRLPPPLDRPLEVAVDGGNVVMRDGEAVVADAREIDELELEIPDPVGVEQAAAAREASPMQHEHPFPECFVCGPARQAGDGLGVTCGPVGEELVASPWHVDDSIPTEDGEVSPEILWSVLDCPGGISSMLLPGVGMSVLGRLAAQIHRGVEPGTTCVAIGWPIERDGRKLQAGSALFSESGELLAHGRATWIELKR